MTSVRFHDTALLCNYIQIPHQWMLMFHCKTGAVQSTTRGIKTFRSTMRVGSFSVGWRLYGFVTMVTGLSSNFKPAHRTDDSLALLPDPGFDRVGHIDRTIRLVGAKAAKLKFLASSWQVIKLDTRFQFIWRE
jgi:hypothetical protein